MIRKFLAELQRNHVPVQQVVLFGSYASGSYSAWSDIDIAIVSPAFTGKRFDDKNMIRKIMISVSSALSPLPFRPEDFVPTDPLVREILETGMPIAA
ncbi:MAG: nucleotidyltransferase domain-containing protein [Candidatus Wallbacteria bacterium]|nr:nucleotidyltransferase domain-containing protein [Candidatus Wallbacteria bacterium]